jgi:CheY-like chemotaxis protein
MPGASIFLVEDEALIRMMLAEMVEELGHRVVAEAGNIKDGQALAGSAVVRERRDRRVPRLLGACHLEMCWHLYMWGDQVEVLAPEALRRMVEPYQRSDFLALP